MGHRVGTCDLLIDGQSANWNRVVARIGFVVGEGVDAELGGVDAFQRQSGPRGQMPFLTPDGQAVEVSRRSFDAAIEFLVERPVNPVRRCLDDVGLEPLTWAPC